MENSEEKIHTDIGFKCGYLTGFPLTVYCAIQDCSTS